MTIPFSYSSKEVLFYYAGFTNLAIPLAGSSRAAFSFATTLAKIYGNTLNVTITSEHIKYPEETPEKVQIVTPPNVGEHANFLEKFHTVVFSTHIGIFSGVTKPANQRWVLDLHCWDIDEAEFLRINNFDFVVAKSELHAEHLRERLGKNKVIVPVFNPVDPEIFHPQPGTFRSPHSLMFAGAIVPHKGLHILMETFASLKGCIPTLTLDVYGSATMWRAETDYENTLKGFNLPGVTFHGATDFSKMPGIYQSHSIMVLPSVLESFGLVTVEAQACGCIPVVHNTGGTSATLKDKETGFLYAPNSPAALSPVLIEAITKCELLRASAVAFAHERFNPERLARDFAMVLG